MNINIPEQYWLGDKCIENRIPWMVPDAIYTLDKFITKNDSVLEIGSGGSTLFFSDRAKDVVTFELSKYWTNVIKNEQLLNVTIYHTVGVTEAENILKEKYSNKKFNVIVIDWDIERDLMARFIPFITNERFCIVLDNYNCPILFKYYFNHDYMSGFPMKYYSKEYNDSKWRGSGTRIYSSESL